MRSIPNHNKKIGKKDVVACPSPVLAEKKEEAHTTHDK